MVWDLVLGFLVLVAGSYIGTTLALRGFFGRWYYDPRTGEFTGDDGPDDTDREEDDPDWIRR
jgi:uncharacterized membrane protein YdjX (TVP38/TMEM64 family)